MRQQLWHIYISILAPLYFMASKETHALQSSSTVAFDHSRAKTPGLVSLPGPSGVPKSVFSSGFHASVGSGSGQHGDEGGIS